MPKETRENGNSVSDSTITCPHCKARLQLTETLAAPLIASLREQYENRLGAKDAELADRGRVLAEGERQLLAEKRSANQLVAEQVAEGIREKSVLIAADEARKAKMANALEQEESGRQIQELRDVLQLREAKLTEAQSTQAELLRKQRELDDKMRESDLTVERKVQASLHDVHQRAKAEAEEASRLVVMEQQQKMAALQKTIGELKRKSEQGSQQLQGEVQELALESQLHAAFPSDEIIPVPNGVFGGDVIQNVVGLGGLCGTILWESKRTKDWDKEWLPKLRADQRAANAHHCVLVSQVLPKGVETFSLVDGVWVASPKVAIAVAAALRLFLSDVRSARSVSEGQQTKAAIVYEYVVGMAFKHRVEAMVEIFIRMQEDLDKEERAVNTRLKTRKSQMRQLMLAFTGMHGDLAGIAGKSLPEIPGLDFDEPAALPPPRGL